nr:SPASM domain-containing protein [Lachnospiraceae bacterium]
CDFYAVDEYKIGNLSEQNIEELLSGKITDDFISRKTAQLKICRDCRYMGICGGGCPKMRREVCGSIDSETCGYQKFLDFSVKKLKKYASQERTYLYKTTT